MEKLEMTDSEIARSYKEALDPWEQINILADLNETTPAVICEVLKSRGFEVRPKHGGAKLWGMLENPTKEQIMERISMHGYRSFLDCEKVVDLYLAGKRDAEIGEVIGTSHQNVRYWRKSRGLPSIAREKQKQQKPKKEPKKPVAKPKKCPMGIEDDIEGSIKSQIKKDTGREELVKLIHGCAEMIADYLIARGVTVMEDHNG